MTLHPGEIRGLVGQNGSGKSTLIKILAGYHSPDPGAVIRAYGEEVPLPVHAAILERLGWAFVHQELGLIESLTVLDNLHLAHLGSSRGPLVRWRRDKAWATELLERFDVNVSVSATIRELAASEKAMVAIVRATESIRQLTEVGDVAKRGLLVLDEPTVYLPESEAEQLFGLVRRVANDGVGVIFVSHQLSEVQILTDTVTVLRDGRVTAEGPTRELGGQELLEAIVGSPIERKMGVSTQRLATTPFARVSALSGGRLRDVSLEIFLGEVLGVTGLTGSGFEDMPYLLFGATHASSGALSLGEATVRVDHLTPHRALALGVALIPGNRLAQGAVGGESVKANITLIVLERFFTQFVFRHRRERDAAYAVALEFDVRPPNVAATFAHLSGGNQQRALLGKWLQRQPSLLLLHEPTQGLDVGARAQMLERLRELASRGTAILCASSDFEQLELLCDRVIVIRAGAIAAVLEGDAISESRLANESYRSSQVPGGGSARQQGATVINGAQ
jgi:ribose transport system ATP-binding protein